MVITSIIKAKNQILINNLQDPKLINDLTKIFIIYNICRNHFYYDSFFVNSSRKLILYYSNFEETFISNTLFKASPVSL